MTGDAAMPTAFDPTAVSSLAQEIAQHIGPLQRVTTAHLHLWLPALTIPSAWTIADADGAAVTRLLLRRLNSSNHWDSCEVLNLYRVPGAVPAALVLCNADRILRDSQATDINAQPLDIPPQYGIIGTRASGHLTTGNRQVFGPFNNYIVNSAAGRALIEQAVVVGSDAQPSLAEECAALTENLYRSLLASIDRPHDPGL
ncbi:hypothetical protein [Mycobacterium sp. 1245852.3]|uniref:hypothetical protein n=1 Tax=Mycobacterium sp. 1245852.3 TaxID=1856860 RepID=UPI000A468724|nr:hypothetical protein [Mycobacterium sp. 1245852.3]